MFKRWQRKGYGEEEMYRGGAGGGKRKAYGERCGEAVHAPVRQTVNLVCTACDITIFRD